MHTVHIHLIYIHTSIRSTPATQGGGRVCEVCMFVCARTSCDARLSWCFNSRFSRASSVSASSCAPAQTTWFHGACAENGHTDARLMSWRRLSICPSHPTPAGASTSLHPAAGASAGTRRTHMQELWQRASTAVLGCARAHACAESRTPLSACPPPSLAGKGLWPAATKGRQAQEAQADRPGGDSHFLLQLETICCCVRPGLLSPGGEPALSRVRRAGRNAQHASMCADVRRARSPKVVHVPVIALDTRLHWREPPLADGAGFQLQAARRAQRWRREACKVAEPGGRQGARLTVAVRR